MNFYELMFIVNGELTKEDAGSEFEKFKEIVEKGNGEILKVDEWGLKKLAYPIKKKNTGYYYVVLLKADYELVKEIERNFRINENLFRHLFVKLDQRKVDIPAEK